MIAAARSFVAAAAAIFALATPAETTTVVLRSPDASPCRAQVAPLDGTGAASASCGEPVPFDPSAGNVGWIETDRGISPFVVPIARGASELTLSPLVPAGTVALPRVAPDTRVHILGLGEQRFGGEWRPLFRRPVAARESTVRVPAGPVVALTLDRQNDVLALSPAVVAAGSTAKVEWPAASADVIAFLDRPDPGKVDVAIADGDRQRPPDLIANGADQLVAIWRNVRSRSVRLTVESPALWLPAQDLAVRPRGVTTLRASLRVRPRLDVMVGSLPEGAPKIDGAKLTVVDAADRPLRELPLTPGTTHTFEALPAERLRVLLQIQEWKIAKSADLSGGADALLSFDLQPIVVEGVVHYGGEPSPATLRFHQFDKWIPIETDDRGRYSVMLWQPRYYFIDVSVHARGESTPFRDAVMLTQSRTLDFHVPKTSVTVRVSSSTGAPVAGVLVSARNIWQDDETGRHQQVFPVKTGERGVAELPPLRPGTLEIDASAAGFARPETVRLPIDSADLERTIDVVLEPLGESDVLTLRLPGGAPAAAAEVIIVSRPSMTAVSRMTAADDGTVSIAKAFAGALVLVRHPNAASLARVADDSREWQLAPPAPPLPVRVVRGSGDEPVQAHLTVWFGGIPLSGPHLGFLTWSPAASGRDGMWLAKNLPREPLRIAAIPARKPAGETPLTVLEALAVVVPHPWTPNALVKTTD